MPPPEEILRAIRAERERREAQRRAEAELRNVEQNAAAIRERCRSFSGFVKEAWHVLEPSTPLKWGWHMQAMCDHLEGIAMGTLHPWLMISVPPGSSKSTIVSVMWQAWMWGPHERPSWRYVTTSFEIGNVTRDTRKTRDLIESEWYRTLWPDVVLTRRGEASFANSATGTREGVAFVAITGKRGDALGIDDPHSLDGAESEADRSRAIRRFLEGGLNRLNDQSTSAIVIVMQRLHELDLIGAILARDLGFVYLMIPMEFEPQRACATPLPWEDPRTFDGELMDPVRMPQEACDKLKLASAHAYTTQYQLRPTAREGGLFKFAWFPPPVGAAPARAKRVRAWDFASTIKKSGNRPDWTVGLLLCRAEGIFYIEDVIRLRGTPGDVEKTVILTAHLDRQRYGLNYTVTVPKDPGQAGVAQAATYVQKLAGFAVVEKAPTGDKETRARPAASQAQARNILMVEGAWNMAFINEVCAFPGGAHDDQVDALSDAFNELTLGDTFDIDKFIKANT